MKITCEKCGFVRDAPFCPECDTFDTGEAYAPRYDGLEGLEREAREERHPDGAAPLGVPLDFDNE
jgi:hypothetical protein